MAGTSTRQYNLRSSKQEGLQIPIQTQLSEDIEFLRDLLQHQNGQVSDSESSISEADCEALVNNSELDSFTNVSRTSSPRAKNQVLIRKIRIICNKLLTQRF